MIISNRQLIKESKVIDDVLSPLTLKKTAETELSHNSIISALSKYYSDISGSEDKADELQTILYSGEIFQNYAPLRIFKKVCRFFNIPIEKAFINIAGKLTNNEEFLKTVTDDQIKNIVNAEVASITPADMAESDFKSRIYDKFASENDTKRYVRIAKICLAQSTEEFAESFNRYKTSKSIVSGIANKVLTWIFCYLVSATKTKK